MNNMREKIWKKLKNKGTARLLAAAMIVVLLCDNSVIVALASTDGLGDGLSEQTEQVMEQSTDAELLELPEGDGGGSR